VIATERERYAMKSKIDTTSTVIDRPEPWINSAQASSHLGISIVTLRRWIKQGKLIPKRTPTGEFRFIRSRLDDVLG